MNQWLESINDDTAQQLLGGKFWGNKWGLYKPSKPILGIGQSVTSPIQSSAISISRATAINISIFSNNSPQIATATAISSSTSFVEGGAVTA
ncbi:hypothetical protein [Synechococcus elongatus]|uniref:hypothetical protein n=1 Tax=Synechococcus elongatus TaxID=32046 RepID=UPI000F7EEF08|nr:hypothetical protein [Synechococcus elongatus]